MIACIFALIILYIASVTFFFNLLAHPAVRRKTYAASSHYLNLPLRTEEGWKKATANSHASHSLDTFLSSCNISLTMEVCSALSFQRNEVDGAGDRKPCLWGKRSTFSTLLRQLEQALIFARLAHFYDLPHIFEEFSSQGSEERGASFEWVDSFFGLLTMFRSLKSTDASDRDATAGHCNHIVRPSSNLCNPDAFGAS